jgi:hypothetical protein
MWESKWNKIKSQFKKQYQLPVDYGKSVFMTLFMMLEAIWQIYVDTDSSDEAE